MKTGRYRGAGKAWDQRFYPRLSKLEVERLSKDDALLVLPIGAVEQHGPHMPVFTDTLISETVLTEAFEQLPDDANIWLLPAIPYGKSTEHLGHPGTISLSATTLMAVLMDIAKSLRMSRFEKLVLVNTHGGNTDLLNMMAREIRVETGMAVFRLDPGGLGSADGWITPVEKQYGIHAGDVETSLVLAAQPDWVHMELAPTEFPQFPDSRYLQFRSRAFAWVMDDLSRSGISGDASKATVSKGEAMVKRYGEHLAEALMDMSRFDMKSFKIEMD
ncbi:creatininase family protein [Paenibacillus radicis (ex Xue et al. 2023)]|uniref:Creatininase family protein n=1 Tax=Paenibacillus radicis (ex Xue et al. 2023) TaxID=2972489 RepID=A0ABT1YJG3_9BACL|nr:creatininase family protein [Paenibacillus radicis (ex Xue et al. 2023)]MCR8633333.1 creatininase family protein [Paenibacillus radicis (ex Xue et al. 2023)]